MSDLSIKTYAVTVDGFPPVMFSARTPAKARVSAWNSYSNYDDRCDFKKFLSISRIARVDDPPGVGRRVMVAGLPATTVLSNRGGGHMGYMRDDSHVIFTAHPSEVSEIETSAELAKDAT